MCRDFEYYTRSLRIAPFLLSNIIERTVAPLGPKRSCFDADEFESIIAQSSGKDIFDSFWKFRC